MSSLSLSNYQILHFKEKIFKRLHSIVLSISQKKTDAHSIVQLYYTILYYTIQQNHTLCYWCAKYVKKNNTHCVYTCRTTTSMNIIIVWVLSKQRALSNSSNPSLWARSEVISLWPDKAWGIPGIRGFSATFLLWASASDCLPLLCNTLQIRRTGELQNNKSFQISCNSHKRPSDIVWHFECCLLLQHEWWVIWLTCATMSWRWCVQRSLG